jgi:hypothetical protein
MDQRTILPGLSAGIFWAIAQCGFFVGSIKLGLTIGTSRIRHDYLFLLLALYIMKVI